MDEEHHEAVARKNRLGRFAMHAHATKRMQQITRGLTSRSGTSRARDVLVRAAQANCEKPIRAIFFCGERRRTPKLRDLTGSVGRGTLNCASAANPKFA
jgi:hypothetical protein